MVSGAILTIQLIDGEQAEFREDDKYGWKPEPHALLVQQVHDDVHAFDGQTLEHCKRVEETIFPWGSIHSAFVTSYAQVEQVPAKIKTN